MPENSNTLLDKLNTLKSRYEEVKTLITDPEVIANQQRYVKLTKEYKELEDLMTVRQECRTDGQPLGKQAHPHDRKRCRAQRFGP